MKIEFMRLKKKKNKITPQHKYAKGHQEDKGATENAPSLGGKASPATV